MVLKLYFNYMIPEIVLERNAVLYAQRSISEKNSYFEMFLHSASYNIQLRFKSNGFWA